MLRVERGTGRRGPVVPTPGAGERGAGLPAYDGDSARRSSGRTLGTRGFGAGSTGAPPVRHVRAGQSGPGRTPRRGDGLAPLGDHHGPSGRERAAHRVHDRHQRPPGVGALLVRPAPWRSATARAPSDGQTVLFGPRPRTRAIIVARAALRVEGDASGPGGDASGTAPILTMEAVGAGRDSGGGARPTGSGRGRGPPPRTRPWRGGRRRCGRRSGRGSPGPPPKSSPGRPR